MHDKMFHRTVVAILFLIVAGAAWRLSAEPDQALEAQAVKDQAELAELLPKLVKARQVCLDATKEAYKKNAVSVEQVVRAHRELLEAKLQMRITDAERIKIREDMVDNAKVMENTVKALFDAAAKGGEIEKYYQAVAMRLQAEIDLRRERISAALKH